ncbi:MAG: hypothetical protein CV087_16065 [Candidatus Brocadia sp. WS118]|nr:MAG: hypothetical protein CV087_16065 [Candidatus Brocadia sp. WS118]
MAIYPSGSIINNRYEVVQGPHEKPSLAGGMGLVYLCVDRSQGGLPVALKTFRPEYLPNREARDRFLREGSTWVELGYHPHIVRCYGVVKAVVGPEVFLVLQLVTAAEGKHDASLRAWLTPGKPLLPEQALLFALHITRGMRWVTEKVPGLVHRDLKPENVLVGRDGLARITDFGLVQVLTGEDSIISKFDIGDDSGESRQRTQLTQGIAGTPCYMSPEQGAGETLDVCSDIYAFGCILYEMLTGEFAVVGKNIEEFLQAHREGRLRAIPTQLPVDTRQLLERCLARQPEDRYRSWEGVENALVQVYHSLSGSVPQQITDRDQDANRVERLALGWSYNTIGVSYYDIGKFGIAKGHFEKASAIAQEIGDRYGEGSALGNLGNTYLELGDVRRAIDFFEQNLAITKEIGDHHGEGTVLGNLGNAYLQLGDARRAIGFYEQDLAIAREIGDRQGEGRSVGNLGNAYFRLGDAQRAIDFFEQRLDIAREIGDRHGEGQALGNLGIVYEQWGDARQAIGFYEQHLTIVREMGDRQGEAAGLGNLGVAYRLLGDAHRALGFFEQSLVIAQEIGDRGREGVALGNLGNAYFQLGDVQRAIGFYEQHLTIAKEIGDRYGESQALGNLGNAHFQLGHIQRAIGFYEQRLAIAYDIGDVMGAAKTNLNLARLLLDHARPIEALPHAQSAGQTFEKAGHIQYAVKAQELIEQIKTYMG